MSDYFTLAVVGICGLWAGVTIGYMLFALAYTAGEADK